MKRVALISLNVRGYYSTALDLISGYALGDSEIRENYSFRIYNVSMKIVKKVRLYKPGFADFFIGLFKDCLLFNFKQADIRIKQALEYNGFYVRVSEAMSRLAASIKILAGFPDIVGFSCSVWNIRESLRTAALIKKFRPGVILVFGGQEVTNSGPAFAAAYPFIDYVVDGEGEQTFKEILLSLLKQKQAQTAPIPGCAVNGAPFIKREPIADLGGVPTPYLSLIKNKKMMKVVLGSKLGCMIESSRGCPFKCTFCFESDRFNSVRYRPLKNITDELMLLSSLGAYGFHILDPTLCGLNKGRTREIADIIRSIEGHENFKISVEVYLDYLIEGMIGDLDVFYSFDAGLQTVNPHVLKKIRRVWNQERFTRGFSLLKQLKGKIIAVYLIFGLPGESYFSFIKSVIYVLSLEPDLFYVNKLSLLSGTSLRRDAPALKLDYSESPPYHIKSTPDFSEEEIGLCDIFTKSMMWEFNTYNYRRSINA